MKQVPEHHAAYAVRDAQYIQHVCNYYDETWLDYRLLWMHANQCSCGFGYWDPSVRNHSQSLIRINEILAHHAQLRPGLRVLDAGCGVAFAAVWIAERYGTPVVGITVVRDQVQRARALVRRRNLERLVRIELQDYRNTTFPDASFDVVWAKESMDYCPDKHDFLREAFRLLRPGGRLVIEDGFRFARPYARDDEALMCSWLSGWAILDLATRDEFIQWTREAGFQDVRIENIQSHMFPSHRRLYRIANLFYVGEYVLHKLHVRSDIQHANIRAARDQYRALRRNLWFEAIVSAKKPPA